MEIEKLILKLPPFDHKIKESEGKKYIFDEVRKKYVFLSPEEWVRQHLSHMMMRYYDYPRSLMKIESALSYNKLLKRSDLKVFDRNGKVFLLAECKAPEIKLDNSTVKQITTYNADIQARFLLITNGNDLYCWEGMKADPQFLEDLPVFPN